MWRPGCCSGELWGAHCPRLQLEPSPVASSPHPCYHMLRPALTQTQQTDICPLGKKGLGPLGTSGETQVNFRGGALEGFLEEGTAWRQHTRLAGNCWQLRAWSWAGLGAVAAGQLREAHLFVDREKPLEVRQCGCRQRNARPWGEPAEAEALPDWGYWDS